KATGAEYVLFADAAVTFPFPRRPAMAKFSSWAMSLSRSCIHRGIRPNTFHLSQFPMLRSRLGEHARSVFIDFGATLATRSVHFPPESSPTFSEWPGRSEQSQR